VGVVKLRGQTDRHRETETGKKETEITSAEIETEISKGKGMA
jgi:hypothetical protein